MYTIKRVRLLCLTNGQKLCFDNYISLHVQNLFNCIHCYTSITGVMGKSSMYCHYIFLIIIWHPFHLKNMYPLPKIFGM